MGRKLALYMRAVAQLTLLVGSGGKLDLRHESTLKAGSTGRHAALNELDFP